MRRQTVIKTREEWNVKHKQFAGDIVAAIPDWPLMLDEHHNIDQQIAWHEMANINRAVRNYNDFLADHPEPPPAPALNDELMEAVREMGSMASTRAIVALAVYDARPKPALALAGDDELVEAAREVEKLLNKDFGWSSVSIAALNRLADTLAAHDAWSEGVGTGLQVTEWVSDDVGKLYPLDANYEGDTWTSQSGTAFLIDSSDRLLKGTRVTITVTVTPKPEPEPMKHEGQHIHLPLRPEPKPDFVERITEVFYYPKHVQPVWVKVEDCQPHHNILGTLSRLVRENMSVTDWADTLKKMGIGYRYINADGTLWEYTVDNGFVATEVK